LNPFLLNFIEDPHKLVLQGLHLLFFLGVSNQFSRTCKPTNTFIIQYLTYVYVCKKEMLEM